MIYRSKSFVPVSTLRWPLVRLRRCAQLFHDGMIERLHMHDAVARMWLEGELAAAEDLVCMMP